MQGIANDADRVKALQTNRSRNSIRCEIKRCPAVVRLDRFACLGSHVRPPVCGAPVQRRNRIALSEGCIARLFAGHATGQGRTVQTGHRVIAAFRTAAVGATSEGTAAGAGNAGSAAGAGGRIHRWVE